MLSSILVSFAQHLAHNSGLDLKYSGVYGKVGRGYHRTSGPRMHQNYSSDEGKRNRHTAGWKAGGKSHIGELMEAQLSQLRSVK